MRSLAPALLAAGLLSAATPARADELPVGPSETLERGLRLYERKDFAAASIELFKVASNQTADSESKRLEARLALARSLDQMGFSAVALAILPRIVHKGPSVHARPALRALVILNRELPGSPAMAQIAGSRISADDQALAGVRDDLLLATFQWTLKRKGAGAAEPFVGRMSRGSRQQQRALLALALKTAGARGWAEAQRLVAQITDPVLRAQADLVRGRSLAFKKQWKDALAAFEAAASSKTRWARLAELEGSLARLQRDRALPPLIAEPELLVAMVYDEYCHKGLQPDAMASARAEADAVIAMVTNLEKISDHADRYRALTRLLDEKSPASPRARMLLRATLGGDAMTDALGWANELARQRARFQKTDRAWQSSAVASQVQKELALQESQAVASAGRLARIRLMRLRVGMTSIKGWSTPLPTVTRAAEPGLLVAPQHCPKSTPMYRGPANEIPEAPSKGPAPATPAKRGGCAGCSGSGGGAGAIAALIAALLIALRRHRETTG